MSLFILETGDPATAGAPYRPQYKSRIDWTIISPRRHEGHEEHLWVERPSTTRLDWMRAIESGRTAAAFAMPLGASLLLWQGGFSTLSADMMSLRFVGYTFLRIDL